jgi:hypothetical protein
MKYTHSAIIFIFLLVVVGVSLSFMPHDTDTQEAPLEYDNIPIENAPLIKRVDGVSIQLPDGWQKTQPATAAILTAESPDWKTEWVGTEISGGTHIVEGAHIEVFGYNIDIGNPPTRVGMPASLEGVETLQVEDNLLNLERYREQNATGDNNGVILQAKIKHNSNYYTFRIAFNPVTYPEGEDVFMRILQSIQFTQ